MRWLWRLVILFVFLAILQTLTNPKPMAFITWPEGQNWVQKIKGEMKQFQKLTQDLPASIEVEVRRLWKDFQPNGEGLEV